MSGSVTTEMTELIAVRVMLRATSPRKRWLNRLVVAPGDDASSIMPMPSSGLTSKASTRPKQTAGRATSRHASATATAFGDDAWRRGLMDIGHDPLKP